MNENKCIRLQGAEWHKVKDRMVLISYRKNDHGHVKGFYKEKDRDGVTYSHWMNDGEIEEFYDSHTPKVIHKEAEVKQALETNIVLIKSLRQYIDTKIQKSFIYDWGMGGNYKDRLMTETVVELQLILEKIDDILESIGGTND